MNSADPFAKYRLNKDVESSTEKPIQQTEINDESSKENIFDKYKIKNKEQEGFYNDLTRHAARIGSRVAETIGGIPGDIQDLIQSGIFYGIEKLTGTEFTPEMRREAALKSERLPTSKELKEFSEKSTKGYTKARSSKEELVDEYASTVASLLGPMKFRRALGVAALGIGTKKGTEILGFKEGTQEASKLGTILVASMFNPKGVKQLYTNYYNEALKHAPEGTLVSAKPLEFKLEKLRKKLTKGIGDITEKSVLDAVEDVSKKIKDGKVDVQEMMATNRNINKRMGDPALLIGGQNLFPELHKAVNDSIKLYKNPEFLKNWKSANEAFAGFHESKKLSRFITRHLGNKPLEKAIFTAIAETAGGYPEAIIPTLGGAGAAYAGIKAIELSKRIFSNPTLRKYYGEVLLNAAKEDSVAMIKSAEKLQKELDKKSH